MAFLVALTIPIALMLLVLAMERVERPLRDHAVGDRIAETLLQAPADEIELLVSRDAASAFDRYWRRQSLVARIRPGRTLAR